MEVTPQSPAQLSENAKPSKPRNRQRFRKATANGHSSESTNVPSTHTSRASGDGDQRAKGPRRHFGAKQPGSQVTNGRVDEPLPSGSGHSTVEGASGEKVSGKGTRNPKRHNPPKDTNESNNRGPHSNWRGAKFNADLTESSTEAASTAGSSNQSYKYKRSAPKGDDLTSNLIHALSTPPYPDCPICFAAIHPAQPTWSCSLSRDNRASDGDNKENESSQCCWTTFHLKCIKNWSSKSVKEIADAWRARGEDRPGEWRCPGCQSKRLHVPDGYWCFCGSTAEPKLARLATPHSCANPCSRPRSCGHGCPLACHPGPCPPCLVMTQLPCHCGKQMQYLKCSQLAPGSVKVDLSCAQVCGKKLGCQNHTCEDVCHPGDCRPCVVKDVVRCYCGKTDREVSCGYGEGKECVVNGEDGAVEKWTGRFQCENNCDRPFDCGKHHCSKPCHPPSSTPPPCPRSPSRITHCPCGKHALDPTFTASFPPNANLSRTSCSDPIPTCSSICMRPLENCSHVCSSVCHTGACPPCSIMLVRPCRCGATTKDVQCSNFQSSSDTEILCDRPCAALRACGRHQCNRLCCPLASLGGPVKGKGKKRAAGTGLWDGVGADETGLHECDLPCGKVLGCGNHRCEERDHRGACPPCLQSSFEEMVCYCGRTLLDPPIPCGTRINCSYPCSRPPLACGHPKTHHSCHEDPAPCPPCPFLANKTCACGKKVVTNVRCSQEKVSCGATCGKLLGCGFHHCERLCHGDDCGPCNSACGKSRKLCLPANHPCALSCHAPSSCSEAEPCRATVTLTCPCGRIRQSAPCGRSTSNPSREATQQVKCSNECLVAKRNARLAEALGINPEGRDKSITYNDELTVLARANVKFLGLVEKSFAEFILSEKKTQVLPHMPMDRRKFVHDLAMVYRMDAQMVDQEPHRSVQLIRRIDTRIPFPLLSATITPSAPPSLGKLADLRSPSAQSVRPLKPSSSNPSRTATPVGSSNRGWTSVVSTSAAAANPAPAATSWMTSGNGRPSAPRSVVTAAQPVAAALPVQPDVSGSDVPDSWEDDA